MGFRASFFEDCGCALVDMLMMDEFVQTCPDGRKAWMLFFAYLTDALVAESDKRLTKVISRHQSTRRGCVCATLVCHCVTTTLLIHTA